MTAGPPSDAPPADGTSSGADAAAADTANAATTAGDATDADAADADATDADGSEPREDADVLRARLDVLSEENERLRREYVRARRAQHRRAALVLGLFGALAVAGAVAFDSQREVLLALGGTGLFGAALTYYLTPERFVAASVAERIHDAHVANQRALSAELGLQELQVYVPAPAATEPARLFVPQHPDYEVPEAPEHLLVVTDDPAGRGVALVPSGARLYEEFEATVTGEPASEPAALAAQLADAVVESFELADAAAVEPDLDGGRVVLTVSEPAYGDLDAPDHPIVSVVGTGLATAIDAPVTASVEETGETGRIVYEWEEEAGRSGEANV